MNKVLTLALCMSVSTLCVTFAQAQTSTKRDIQRLARSIDESLLDTTSSESDLVEARDKMESALKLIRQGGGSGGAGTKECIEYAYAKYSQTMGSATAMDKASAVCRSVDSLEVLKFLYEKYSQTQGSATALDSAAKGATSSMAGKLAIVKYAYERYSQTQGSATAATNAVALASMVRSDSLSCIDTAYSRYSQTQGSATAMDSAARACR